MLTRITGKSKFRELISISAVHELCLSLYLEGILGPYPDDMLNDGRYASHQYSKFGSIDSNSFHPPHTHRTPHVHREVAKFFTVSRVIYERQESTGYFSLLYPKRTSLRARLHLPLPPAILTDEEHNFLDFTRSLLELDPNNRLSCKEALDHPWLQGDLGPIDGP